MNITKSLYKKFNDIDYNFNLQPRHLLEHFDKNPNSIPDDKFLYFECCDDMESIDEMLEDIKKIHDKYNIDYNKIIFVTSIPILDWDNRPSLIDKINYYELESLITYSAFDENGSSSACHMFDSIESFPNHTKLCIKTVFENSKSFVRQKHYLTYNGYMKEHRVKLLGFLVEKDLLDKGLSSFFYYDEGQLSKEFINEYTYGEIEDKTVISKIRKLVPYSFDNYRHGFDDPDNASVAGFNITSQFSTYFNIVTESRFGDQSEITHAIFLSDKICKPLFLFQPFIVISQRGSLEILKRMGFKTFSPWINEEYDLMTDSDRMSAALKEVEKLCRLDINDLHKWYWEMEDILVHNFNHFVKLNDQGPKKFRDFMENVIRT